MGSGVDFLTATVGAGAAEALVGRSEVVEGGRAVAGFGLSEKRAVWGGEVWRRWRPHQPSPVWGQDYESWEADGGNARWPAEFLRDFEDVRPSRVDVAFDFAVEDSERAEVVVAPLAAHLAERGIKEGGVHDGEIHTKYIGSRASDRRVRIYRKDLRDASWLILHGPVLRVELILRDAEAWSWWHVWRRSTEEALRAAAGHVFEMTGRTVLADAFAPPPPLPMPGRDADAAQMVFQFVQQNASMIELCRQMGVDLAGLARVQMERRGKASLSRHRQRMRDCADLVGGQIEELVLWLMGRTPQTDAS